MEMKYSFFLLVSFLFLSSCAADMTLAQRREANIRAIYDHLVYPNPLPLIRSNGTLATFFHPNVTGRINPVGVFGGRQDTVEYFYALGNPVSGTISDGERRVIENDIRILDIVGTRASIQVNIHFANYPSNDTTTNLTQTGWFGFNPDDDRVAFYDLTIIRLDQEADEPAAYNPAIIESLCTSQSTTCVGANQQFDNVSSCEAFMNTIDFGSWGNAWSNTVVCRLLHNTLTQVRPEFHCPHVGPTGGEKCVYHSYDSWYATEYVVNLPPDTTPTTTTTSSASLSSFSFIAGLPVFFATLYNRQ